MPKKPLNLSSVVFYVITSKDLTIKDKYVGSTTNLVARRNAHKTSCNNENDKKHNTYVYCFIRENGGWSNWEVVEIERKECVDKSDVLKRERFWLEQRGATLNKNVPSRTQKEWESDNKEQISEKNKQYHNQNREQLIEKSKKYNEQNREQINEQMKQIRKDSETINCDCGGRYKLYRKSDHVKTKRHIAYTNSATPTP